MPDVPDEMGEKKKRPREVAFMDVNLCFPCGKCLEFCPVQCIEYLARLISYLEGACSRYKGITHICGISPVKEKEGKNFCVVEE